MVWRRVPEGLEKRWGWAQQSSPPNSSTHKINLEEMAKSKKVKSSQIDKNSRESASSMFHAKKLRLQKAIRLNRSKYQQLEKVKAKPMFPFSPYTQTFHFEPKAQWR